MYKNVISIFEHERNGRLATQKDTVADTARTTEFRADKFRKEGVQGTRKGRSQGIALGISRNIAAFSRADSRESTESPLFVQQPYTYGTFSTRAMISLFVSSPIKGCNLLVSPIRLLDGFHQATRIE